MVRRNVPLVEQVILEILAEIDGGQFARPDGLIPSEEALSQQLGVSRATLREALSKLETTGVIIRRHGVGTFVNQFLSKQPALIQDWFEEAHGFVETIRASGREVDCRILDCRVAPANELGVHLELKEDEPVIITEKVIGSLGTPLIHSVNVVPVSLLPLNQQPQAAALAAQCDSTYRFLEIYCSARVHHQQSEIRAELAGDTAHWLDCRPEDACLRVEEIAYRSDLTPLFYGINRFRGDRVNLRQIRRPTFAISSSAA